MHLETANKAQLVVIDQYACVHIVEGSGLQGSSQRAVSDFGRTSRCEKKFMLYFQKSQYLYPFLTPKGGPSHGMPIEGQTSRLKDDTRASGEQVSTLLFLYRLSARVISLSRDTEARNNNRIWP